jgi:hypothetical protein
MPYWKTIGEDNLKHEKTDDSDVAYDRVTEVLSAHPKSGCEKAAYMVKTGKEAQIHIKTLAGTIVHWKIEKYLAEKYDLNPPPPLEEELTKKQWEVYQEEIMKEDYVVNGRTIKNQRIIPYIMDAYANFEKFMDSKDSIWNRYKMKPLYLERRVWCEEHKYGGTVDCIAIAIINGVEQIVMVDWKSGKTTLDEHHWQLAAYHHALKEMIDKGLVVLPMDIPLSNKVWCVKFGGRTWQASMYNAEQKGALKEFFRAKEIFDTVTNTPRGWCIRCMFCPFRWGCLS